MGTKLSTPSWSRPPPAGYTPVVGLKFCPPRGVYVDLAFWLVDFANDGVQIATFVKHQDYQFAALSSGVMAFSGIMFYLLVISQQKSGLLHAARESVAAGFLSDAWHRVIMIERTIEAPWTGLIAPYGMTLSKDLDNLQAASAVFGFLFSAKHMGAQQADTECGQAGVAGALIPGRVRIIFLWRICGAAAELTSFAIATRVLHPALTIPSYWLSNVANGYAHGKCSTAAFGCISFNNMLFGYTSTLNLKYPLASGATFAFIGWPIAAATLLRFAIWITLCCTLELPHGIMDWGTFGRPMGWTIFREEFLQIGLTVAEYAKQCTSTGLQYLTTQDEEKLQCSLSAEGHSNGSTIFNAIILGIAFLSLPLYLIGIACNLLCNGRYRRGEIDEELQKLCDAKLKEVADWAEEQKIRYSSLGRTELAKRLP